MLLPHAGPSSLYQSVVCSDLSLRRFMFPSAQDNTGPRNSHNSRPSTCRELFFWPWIPLFVTCSQHHSLLCRGQGFVPCIKNPFHNILLPIEPGIQNSFPWRSRILINQSRLYNILNLHYVNSNSILAGVDLVSKTILLKNNCNNFHQSRPRVSILWSAGLNQSTWGSNLAQMWKILLKTEFLYLLN